MTTAQLRREVARLRAWAEAIEASRHPTYGVTLPKLTPEQVRHILRVLVKAEAATGPEPTGLSVMLLSLQGMTAGEMAKFYAEHPNRKDKDNEPRPEEPTDSGGSGGELPTGT